MRSSEACEPSSCFDFHDWPSLYTQLASSLILQESSFSFPFTHARPLFSWDEVHQVTHFNQVMYTMTSNITTTQSDYLCSPLKGDVLGVPLFDRQSASMSRKNSASGLQVETLAERKRQVCRVLPLLPAHIRITAKKSTTGIQQGLVQLSLRSGWHIFLPAICSPPFCRRPTSLLWPRLLQPPAPASARRRCPSVGLMESLTTQFWACASSAHDASLLASTSAPSDVPPKSSASHICAWAPRLPYSCCQLSARFEVLHQGVFFRTATDSLATVVISETGAGSSGYSAQTCLHRFADSGFEATSLSATSPFPCAAPGHMSFTLCVQHVAALAASTPVCFLLSSSHRPNAHGTAVHVADRDACLQWTLRCHQTNRANLSKP